MIRVKNLTKRYGDKVVVEDVTLEIESGRITTFIGPNGAGKSTLLGMIARLVDSTAGTVTIDGADLADWKNQELARKLAILKQANHLDIRLTVRELVAFGRFPHSRGNPGPRDQEIIDQAIDWLSLEDIQHRPINELSGGQRQRAFIALVLAQDTEYILLDEPLNNLDMKNAVEIMSILRRIVDELGKTVVIVIHDINFASCYSDRIVALAGGRIRHHDTTEAVITGPILAELYEMPFAVHRIGGRRICTYYNYAGEKSIRAVV